MSCLLLAGKFRSQLENPLRAQRKRATTETKKVKKKLMNSNLQKTMEAELGAKPNRVKTRQEIRNEVFFDTARLIQDEKDEKAFRGRNDQVDQTFPKGRWP